MSANFKLGMNAKAYIGTAGSTPSTELTNIRDVTLTLETGEADITTRGNSGWAATAPTLKSASADFEMVRKENDANFTTIKNAFLANEDIAMSFLTGATGVAGSEGPSGDWAVTNFSRNESLTEAIKVSVSVKLSSFTEWVSVSE